jgi:hypothetical protein
MSFKSPGRVDQTHPEPGYEVSADDIAGVVDPEVNTGEPNCQDQQCRRGPDCCASGSAQSPREQTGKGPIEAEGKQRVPTRKAKCFR